MITKSVRVVSFNDNEAAAVDELLNELALSGIWTWDSVGENDRLLFRPVGADRWEIEHVPLRAQGNVVAAAALADFVAQTRRPLAVLVFYGCAGVSKKGLLNSVYLVRGTTYVSLGKVSRRRKQPDHECATVANKWITTVIDSDVAPLPTVRLSSKVGGGLVHLARELPCSVAHVAATDKVVCVDLDDVPPRDDDGEFKKGQWSYAQGLAYVEEQQRDASVLVDMESYGIARMTRALGVAHRVVIMRISTDTLGDHSGSDCNQAYRLRQGRHVLGSLIHAVFTGQAP